MGKKDFSVVPNMGWSRGWSALSATWLGLSVACSSSFLRFPLGLCVWGTCFSSVFMGRWCHSTTTEVVEKRKRCEPNAGISGVTTLGFQIFQGNQRKDDKPEELLEFLCQAQDFLGEPHHLLTWCVDTSRYRCWNVCPDPKWPCWPKSWWLNTSAPALMSSTRAMKVGGDKWSFLFGWTVGILICRLIHVILCWKWCHFARMDDNLCDFTLPRCPKKNIGSHFCIQVTRFTWSAAAQLQWSERKMRQKRRSVASVITRGWTVIYMYNLNLSQQELFLVDPCQNQIRRKLGTMFVAKHPPFGEDFIYCTYMYIYLFIFKNDQWFSRQFPRTTFQACPCAHHCHVLILFLLLIPIIYPHHLSSSSILIIYQHSRNKKESSKTSQETCINKQLNIKHQNLPTWLLFKSASRSFKKKETSSEDLLFFHQHQPSCVLISPLIFTSKKKQDQSTASSFASNQPLFYKKSISRSINIFQPIVFSTSSWWCFCSYFQPVDDVEDGRLLRWKGSADRRPALRHRPRRQCADGAGTQPGAVRILWPPGGRGKGQKKGRNNEFPKKWSKNDVSGSFFGSFLEIVVMFIPKWSKMSMLFIKILSLFSVVHVFKACLKVAKIRLWLNITLWYGCFKFFGPWDD